MGDVEEEGLVKTLTHLSHALLTSAYGYSHTATWERAFRHTIFVSLSCFLVVCLDFSPSN